MSQTETTVVTTEDRVLPAVVYGLYLLGLVNGLTILVGLVVAYINLDKAGPRMRTHYDFQIRTFWIGLAIFLSLGLLIGISAVLSLVLIGIPFLMLFLFLWGAVGVWFAVRCIIGLVYVSQDQAYPRPNTWLI
ncbi:DUF4870 family protein [Phenylobacterium sp. 58.2.17]|uniref:DUF4870 family protein n=1 Tax=Phenylobacterium sp. 58.2.17 TaxID=2969306 RepID=UPI00226451C4|nr:hypothetical protein [Phenylobacterium sp. 58.2.17]MBS0489369.1 hypothetical protein [Pseudomonadota bacterium]MCX7585683.1 hypothetical protein [Phenylobacterium sp. 58.2.17]